VITVGSDLEAYVKEMNPLVKQVMIENLPVNSANGTSALRSSIEELQVQLKLDGRLSIVYTGNFERYQGVDLLIDSAKIVRERHPEVAFVLVGGKSQQIEYLKHKVNKRHLDDCVVFVGTVPLEEVNCYLELAEILVSPRTEGLSVPLKIYSYLQSGKPIVATKIVAHTLVLDEDTAVLVEPTKDALAAGLLRLIESPESRRRLGVQARRTAQQRYNLENYLTKLDRIYSTLELPSYVVEQPKRLLEKGKASSPEV
jgi:glycosyltransferase involved in cell wall biosynthesis